MADDTMSDVKDDTMADNGDGLESLSKRIPFDDSLTATENVASSLASNAITAARSTPTGAAATEAISLASNISPDASLAAQSAIDKVVPINNVSSTLQKISKNK
jgi:hypothetical protein